MTKLSLLLLVFISMHAFAQAPQGVPYQAVVRDQQGQPFINQPVGVQLSLHNLSATGDVIYRETHTTTTNNLGLFSLNFGMGTPTLGTFTTIEWGNGYKFLQVECDLGAGYVEIGTQQLMSVPYALYAEKSNTTQVSVSAIGDTLHLGNGNFVIVPGISDSNSEVQSGFGSTVLPGVTACATQQISISGCEGVTELEYQGYNYDLVEIAGQCWFKENLRVSQFNDGTEITLEQDYSNWNNPNTCIPSPLYAFYDNEPENQVLYGNFYNISCLLNENICPVGWHVPTKCELDYLAYKLGVNRTYINSTGDPYSTAFYGQDVYLPGMLIDTDITAWAGAPLLYFTPSNSSGLSLKLGGRRSSQDEQSGYSSNIWLSSYADENGTVFYRTFMCSPENYTPHIYFSTKGRYDTFTNTFQGTSCPSKEGANIRCVKN
jgi:uncharacterized protein (TIGR02145 family)